MSDSELQSRVCRRLGLRIEAKMSQYIGRMLASSAQAFAVIGGDARTGIPRRLVLDRRTLMDETSDADRRE